MFSKCLVNQALLSINILLSRISYYVYCKNVLYTLSSTKLCFPYFSLFISSDEDIHLFILYHKQQRSQRQTLHTKLIILIPRKTSEEDGNLRRKMRSLETTEALESTRYLSPRQAIQERHMMSPHVVVVIILLLFHCKPKRNKSTNRLNNSPHDKGGDFLSQDSHKKWKKIY